MSKLSLLILSLFLNTIVVAQLPKVGEKAPLIEIEQMLTKNVPADFYKGKYLVLDFWATWCIPCILSFPYIDSVAKTVEDDNVAFAIISSEHAEKLKRFFKQKKKYDVGLVKLVDQNSSSLENRDAFSGKTFKNFKIKSVPQTFIIDPDGIVRWTGHAMELTGKLIESVIKGGTSKENSLAIDNPLPPENKVLKSDSGKVAGFTVRSDEVSTTMGGSMLNYKGNVGVYFWGTRLDDILIDLHQFRKKQVEVLKPAGAELPVLTFSIQRAGVATPDSVAMVALKELSRYYNFSYHLENREFEAYDIVLKKPRKLIKNGAPFDPANTRGGSAAGTKFAFTINKPFATIASLLSSIYPDAVFELNEKNLDKVKDHKFDLNLPGGNFAGTKKVLKNKYGVKLKKKIISLPVLVVDFSRD